MPAFRNRIAFEIAWGVKAFLSFEAGVGRFQDSGSASKKDVPGNLRKRLERKDWEISALREELARTLSANGQLEDSVGGPPVFFVIGQGKSGTGWLVQLLGSHPEVLCKGEGRFFGREIRRELPEDESAGAARQKRQTGSLYNAIAESEYLRFWVERSVWTRDGDPDEQLDDLTRTAIEFFLSRRLSEAGKRIVGDKTPLPSPEVVREISEVYPGARVIHTIRDGRDVAVSLMHHSWRKAVDQGGVRHLEPAEIETRESYRENPQMFLESGEGIFTEERLRKMAENWRDRVGKTVEDGPTLLGENYIEVRYEDLLQRPEEEAGRLFEFLGSESDEETVRRCVESASFENRSGGRKQGQEEEPLARTKYRKGIAGDWENFFTERDREIFKEVAGNLLIKLGYESDDDW